MYKLAKLTRFTVATALFLASAVYASAETWNFAMGYPDNSYPTQNNRLFADDVAAATKGALTIDVHSAESLFKLAEIKSAVRRGLVPLGEVVLSQLANENPIYGADAVPFLATTFDSVEKLWAAQRPYVEELMAEQGLMVLYAIPWPAQGLWTQKKIDSIADLAGAKFRAYTILTEKLATMAKMHPTQVSGPDVPQAFSTGRVDAMVTGPGYGVNVKAWDFVKHYTAIDAWMPKNIVFVNADAFNRLEPEVQEAVKAAAIAAEKRGFEMARVDTENALKVLRDNGMVISDPTPQLESELKEIGKIISAEWAAETGEAGQAIIDALQ